MKPLNRDADRRRQERPSQARYQRYMDPVYQYDSLVSINKLRQTKTLPARGSVQIEDKVFLKKLSLGEYGRQRTSSKFHD